MNIHHHSAAAASEAAAAAAAAAAVVGHQHAGHHTGHHPVNGGGGAAASSTPTGSGTELSFEDFTAMSPFLDPSTAALHLANPYAASASLASAASNAGKQTLLVADRL